MIIVATMFIFLFCAPPSPDFGRQRRVVKRGECYSHKKVDLPSQEMVDPSRNKKEGNKTQSERNGNIGLESALPKN